MLESSVLLENTATATGAGAGGEEEELKNNGGGGGGGGGGGSSVGGGSEEEDRNFSGGNRWPHEETLALLKIRSEMDLAFRDSNLKSPLWDEISR